MRKYSKENQKFVLVYKQHKTSASAKSGDGLDVQSLD